MGGVIFANWPDASRVRAFTVKCAFVCLSGGGSVQWCIWAVGQPLWSRLFFLLTMQPCLVYLYSVDRRYSYDGFLLTAFTKPAFLLMSTSEITGCGGSVQCCVWAGCSFCSPCQLAVCGICIVNFQVASFFHIKLTLHMFGKNAFLLWWCSWQSACPLIGRSVMGLDTSKDTTLSKAPLLIGSHTNLMFIHRSGYPKYRFSN